jgi:hypothetical protein
MAAREDLASAIQALQRSNFPEHASSDDLAEWTLDLVEADAFLAGLASSALGGGRVDVPPADALNNLADRLAAMRVKAPGDEVILEQCNDYFAVLRRLHLALRAAGGR